MQCQTDIRTSWWRQKLFNIKCFTAHDLSTLTWDNTVLTTSRQLFQMVISDQLIIVKYFKFTLNNCTVTIKHNKKVITMLTNVIPQEPLAGKSFATVFTHQWVCLFLEKSALYNTLNSTFSGKVIRIKVSCSPTGSACLWRWSNSFVLLENMLPQVGQATSLSWVWLRMCSLRRYLILKKASQPVSTKTEVKFKCGIKLCCQWSWTHHEDN